MATAIGQTPIGFLVDRIGGKVVLVVGLALQAAAIAAIGFTGSYWSMLALFTLAGLAHSVYHPADYSILSRTVEDSRLARAFTVHSSGGNLGTMLRTGDAVGAGGLILIDDCADPFGVEAVRASMGAIFTQKLVRARWEDFLPWLREGPGQLVAASLREAVPYRGAPYAAPCFVMVGNESQGLPEAYETACDLRVTMPMRGRADSLNAAVAAAVLAYEVLATLEG
mgnify:CR=1 FL=1